MQGDEEFIALQFVGFIMLVCGTLVYNEIVTVPYEPFSKNTKKQIALRNQKLIEYASDHMITEDGRSPGSTIPNVTTTEGSGIANINAAGQRQMLIEKHRSLGGIVENEKDGFFK